MDEKKRFEILANILRASHFEWRRAALSLNPEMDSLELIKRYWEEVAKDTAAYYLRKIDPEEDLARQVADLFVQSSVAMGEDAEVSNIDQSTGEVTARHNECPWYHWHKNNNLLEEDQPGCDHWLQSVVKLINEKLERKLEVETKASIPAGDGCCIRVFRERVQ